MLKVGTVCSGIGSPEQALKELGIDHEISFACEIDKFARSTYMENFNPNIMLNDITKQIWHDEKLYSDLFIGGIPCQSFSIAGKRLGELDTRGLLFYDFYSYVRDQQPKFFIIENVRGLLSDKKGVTFHNWKSLLGKSENGVEYMFVNDDSLEYNLHWGILNTIDYGLPQNRERVFLIGIRNDLPNDFVFPKKKKLKIYLTDTIEKEVDENYDLSEDLLNKLFHHSNEINSDHIKVKSGVKKGYEVGYVGDSVYFSHTNSKTRRGRIGHKICKTITTECQHAVILKDRIRRLTPLECFRLQGFPDYFFYNAQKVNSNTQLYKQAGNSISVPVIKSIIKNLLKI